MCDCCQLTDCRKLCPCGNPVAEGYRHCDKCLDEQEQVFFADGLHYSEFGRL